jgi:hypothetical protein
MNKLGLFVLGIALSAQVVAQETEAPPPPSIMQRISKVWLPFLAYTAIEGSLRDRYFPAKDSCQDYLQNPGRIRIFGFKSQTIPVRQFVESINQMLGPLGINSLAIYPIKRHDARTSFLLYQTLLLGTKEIATDPVSTISIWSHEFGHVVFAKYFSIEFLGRKYRMRPLIQRAAWLARKKARTSQEQQEFLGLNKISDSILAYNEVFAEIVLTLYLGDPSAVAHAHRMPSALDLGLADQPASAEFLMATRKRFLDMTTWIDPNMWAEIYNPQILEDQASADNEYYKELAPLRGAIWRKYLRNLPQERRSEFLQAYLAAVSEHLILRGQAAINGIGETNPDVNQKFLEILARHFSLE